MERLNEIKKQFSSNKLPKVVITGATGNIGYVLSFMVGQGRLLGPN